MDGGSLDTAEAALVQALRHNSIDYIRRERDYRFTLRQGALRWNAVCRCVEGYVLVYAAYPFKITGSRLCEQLNKKLIRGAAFVEGETLYLRTTADILDEYTAFESVSRALEYNIQAFVEFWGQVQDSVSNKNS